MARIPPQPSGLDNVVTLTDGLRAEGLDETEALDVIYTTIVHVAGHLVYREAASEVAAGNASIPLRRLGELTNDLLAGVPDNPEYRAIRQYAEAYTRRATDRFNWGLERLLAGMRAELQPPPPD